MGSNRLSLTDLLRRPTDRLDASDHCRWAHVGRRSCDHPVEIAFLQRDVILSNYFSEDPYLGQEKHGIQ